MPKWTHIRGQTAIQVIEYIITRKSERKPIGRSKHCCQRAVCLALPVVCIHNMIRRILIAVARAAPVEFALCFPAPQPIGCMLPPAELRKTIAVVQWLTIYVTIILCDARQQATIVIIIDFSIDFPIFPCRNISIQLAVPAIHSAVVASPMCFIDSIAQREGIIIFSVDIFAVCRQCHPIAHGLNVVNKRTYIAEWAEFQLRLQVDAMICRTVSQGGHSEQRRRRNLTRR